MNSTTFDTHLLVKKLKDQGMAENQAEVIVNIVRDAREVDRTDFSTKHDLEVFKRDIIISVGSMMIGLGAFLSAVQFFVK